MKWRKNINENNYLAQKYGNPKDTYRPQERNNILIGDQFQRGARLFFLLLKLIIISH